MSKEEIVLCKMFSGSYWGNESNIGYESLNIFLPDGEDKKETPTSYMYFPADGDYAFSEHGNLKYVLLTQTISGKHNSTCVKLVGMAEVSQSLLKEDCNGEKYTCIGGGYNFDIMSYLYDKYQENRIPEDGKKYIELLDDIKKFFNYIPLKNATGTLKKILQSGRGDKKLRSDLKKLFERAKVLASIHDAQVKRLENVTYGGKKVIDIFKNNSSFGSLNILTTLEVKNLKLFANNIYLVNNKNDFKDLLSNGTSIFFINTKNLSCQKQTTFISSDIDIFNESDKKVTIEDIFKKDGTVKILDVQSFNQDSSLISIIKKEYDELTYSNLFAYFLTFPDFASYLFCKLGNNTKFSTIKVRREENHIDIVVETDDSVFIIENKVKSALNGHAEKDVNGEEFHDQLKRYYEYVEENYKEKKRKYFIFAPNYNPINKENFGSSSDGTEMKKVWTVVPYKDLFNYCKNYSGFSNTLYFDEFKKALEIHCGENLDYYREMCIRLKGI